MFGLIRAFLCMLVAAQFLVPNAAEAQGGETSYARLLTFEEAQEVLHCPWCTSPAFEGTTYFVRTAEDLNVPLADYGVAVNVVELLNRMTRAQSQCDKAGYDLAFDDYAKIVGLGEQVANPDPASETDGVFKLLYPRHDLSSLAEYAVPPFHACGAHRIAGAKANPALASRQGLRWSGR